MKKYRVHVNGVPFEVELEMVEDDEDDLPTGLPEHIAGLPQVPRTTSTAAPAPIRRPSGPLATLGEAGKITSPLTGAINRVIVKEGESFRQGSVLLEIDAMKMNTKVFAPSDGVVVTIHVKEGDNVTQGQVLITIKEA